ncbi:MAG: phosphatidylethanolamine N-methyltransferase [Proteobacteria bacterium]|nr:phosphatidylethanolamine N-methyltransferase [Pseudomonadota bacterium]
MNEANKQTRNRRAVGYWHFMREFVRNPRQIGAICPSSPFLARRMASLVPAGDGVVVELGPGGGAVTAALLSHGVLARDLVLVERSAALSAHLAKRFPGVRLIQGDAMHLSRFDALQRQPVRAIVSSLPLRSLPRAVVRQILEQVGLVSGPGTVFIQFSYALRGSRQGMAPGFERDQAHLVWRNLPPARIEAFRFRAGSMQ